MAEQTSERFGVYAVNAEQLESKVLQQVRRSLSNRIKHNTHFLILARKLHDIPTPAVSPCRLKQKGLQ